MIEYSSEIRHYFQDDSHVMTATDQPNYFQSVSHGNTQAGTHIVLYVHCQPAGIIECAKFKVYGDPFVIAACAYSCQWLEQQPLAAIAELTASHLQSALAIPNLHSDKAIWVESAWQKLLTEVTGV